MTSVAVATLEDTITTVAARCLRITTVIDRDTAFDRLGLDSLATIELAAALETELGCTLPVDVIAEGCNARSLAALLMRDRALARGADRFEQMLADAVLPDDVRPVASACSQKSLQAADTILLTGATGFLGRALLDELLRSTDATIDCLVRRIPDWAPNPRVRFLLGDLCEDALGLVSDPKVDAILHCAATVNWVFGYPALRAANVCGTLELLRLSCRTGAAFHFISSLSVCYSTGAPGTVDETYDGLAGLRGIHLGYAQTKVVAEALVRQAGARGLPVRIYRPALISGHSVTGAYNRDDVIATLIRGCVAMGTAPDLDWCLDAHPVDVVARAIVALSGQPASVFHLAHQHPRHWRECLLWMRMKGYDVRLVSYPAWLRQLERETARCASHPLRPLRSFFLDRPANGLTLPELYEDRRRTFAASDATQTSLAQAGVVAPPLDAALLDTYFDAFVKAGDLSSPKGLNYTPTNVVQPFRAAFQSDHSIISELTAWRSGRPTGLFREGDTIVKVKARDTDLIAVGEALADLVDPAVGRAYRRSSGRVGFTRSHEREIAIYRQTDPRFVRHVPRVVSTTDDGRNFEVTLEFIGDAVLMDAVSQPERWHHGHVARTIDGLAQLHAVWLGREDDVRSQPWLGHVPSTRSMVEMSDLWTALAAHAAPSFAAWGGADLPKIHQRLVERIDDWWPTLEVTPRTLIHNDFNPRNICLRGEPGRLCAYDWELATLGAPQHDLAEFLCFVLPADVSRDAVLPLIEQHRQALECASGLSLHPELWRRGFSSALYDLLVNRLATYAMVNRIRRQPFLPRVVASWRDLYRLFPLENA